MQPSEPCEPTLLHGVEQVVFFCLQPLLSSSPVLVHGHQVEEVSGLLYVGKACRQQTQISQELLKAFR